MAKSSVRQSDGKSSKYQMRNSIDTIRGFRREIHPPNKTKTPDARISGLVPSYFDDDTKNFTGTFVHSTQSGWRKEPVTMSLKRISADDKTDPPYGLTPTLHQQSKKRARSRGLGDGYSTNDPSVRRSDKKRSLTDTTSRHGEERTEPLEHATGRLSSDVLIEKENRLPEILAQEASEASLATLRDTIHGRPDVWKAIQPFLNKNWGKTYSNAEPREKTALLQALSLRMKNNVDQIWFEGVSRMKSRSFKLFMGLVLKVVGSRCLCTVCKTRMPEKQRNCVVLPPEAAGMHELQEVIGRQCVNCYLTPSPLTCKFLAAGKETPVPLPHQPGQGARQQPPHIFHSFPLAESMPSSQIAPSDAPPSTKDQKHLAAVKPMSQTPVPLPIIPTAARPAARPVPCQTGQSQEESVGIRASPEDIVIESAQPSAQGTDGSGRSDLGRDPESAGSRIVADKVVDGSDSSLMRPRTASPTVHSSDESAHYLVSSHTSHTVTRSAHSTSSSVLAQAFKILAEVKQLPDAQQEGTYQKISQALEIIRAPPEDVAMTIQDHQKTIPAADHWELAPGHLARQGSNHAGGTLPPVAFSTHLLRREIVHFDQAQHISRGQKVLNKHVPPSGCVRVCESKADWACLVSVLQGVINVKSPGLEANIGEGGVVLITPGLECRLANTSHEEVKIQFWWTKGD